MRTLLLVLVVLLSSEAHSAKRKYVPARIPAVAPAPDKRAANEAFVNGDYERAIALYTAILTSPRLPSADREAVYVNRGYASLRLNRFEQASADLRQALALDPACAEATIA